MSYIVAPNGQIALYRANAISLSDNQGASLGLDSKGNLLATLNTAISAVISGVETDSIGTVLVRRPDAFQTIPVLVHSGSAVTLQALSTGKSIYITDLTISTDGGAACTLAIQDDANSPVLIEKVELPASIQTIVFSYNTPKVLTISQNLQALCSSSTPNIYVSAAGYII